MTLYIIANWMQGDALSGGDRIFIELSRRWMLRLKIKLFVSEDGWRICQREKLEGIEHEIWSKDKFNKFGYCVSYLYRTFVSLKQIFKHTLKEGDIVYSSSDFWPDCLPGLLLKIRKKTILWIAGFYMFAPSPGLKNSPYRGASRVIGFFYWLTQLPAHYLIRSYADIVFVTTEADVGRFVTKKRQKDKIVVVRGGVDLAPSQNYFNSGTVIANDKRIYDACYVGRFHYQKGVLELIDIWKRVCEKNPNAKLAMIGEGPLLNQVKDKIGFYKLQDNIELLGFKDGQDKYQIFKNSKIVVHPATYDSGGMAAAEAMAWGLPAVSFDLEALKTYYAKGMIKTSCFDLDEFAANILKLLSDKELYEKISQEALAYTRQEWDWDRRAEDIFNLISKI